MKISVLVAALAIGFTGLTVDALAQEPVQNIGKRHPNLMQAQKLSRQAYDRLGAAQRANEFDMGGHAARAKQLLEEANEEMKKAAIVLNRR